MPDIASPLRIAWQRMVDSDQLTGPGVKPKAVLAANAVFGDFGASDRLALKQGLSSRDRS
jgi:hypothetical protein